VFVRPIQDVFLSVSVSHNERAPTEYELWADGPHDGTHAFEIGDPTLSREKVNSVEGTLRYTAERATFEGHLYWARYTGFIQETATGQVEGGLPVQQFQATNARFVGVEGSSSYDLWRDADQSIRAEATYDWVRGTTDQGPAPRIPPWSLTGRLIYQGPVLGGRVEVRHVAAQDRISTFELPTDAYTMVNAFLSVKPIPGRDVRLFVEGRNLTDVAAREHTSFLKEIAPLPGRNIRVGLSYDF
jgi:iron complex outermembrane receptor protein